MLTPAPGSVHQMLEQDETWCQDPTGTVAFEEGAGEGDQDPKVRPSMRAYLGSSPDAYRLVSVRSGGNARYVVVASSATLTGRMASSMQVRSARPWLIQGGALGLARLCGHRKVAFHNLDERMGARGMRQVRCCGLGIVP
ncbi:hypothetical protein LIA77_02750 [Sarocladium implicatum]|nr:hypothetical protein LIA77_02750 [Sarocladium implicatum]